jgi:FeS assembly protein IscX
MGTPLLWSDTWELAFRLAQKHPDVAPLTLRFTDLHRMVTELEGFADDPLASNERLLEALQMAWVDELED